MTAVGTIVIVINSSVAACGMAYSVVMFMLLGLVYGSLLNCPKKQVGVMAFLCAQRIEKHFYLLTHGSQQEYVSFVI